MPSVNIMQDTFEDKEDVYLSDLIKQDLAIVKPSINQETGEIAFTLVGFKDDYKIDGTLVIDVPVDKITAVSFNNQDELTSVTFQTERDANALKEIGSGAFLDCKNLEEFPIPASVERLGHGIFTGCNSLTDDGLYYGGSASDWEKLVQSSTKYNEAGEAINRWDEGAALPNLHPAMNAIMSDEKMSEAFGQLIDEIRQAEQQASHSTNEPAIKEEVRTLNFGFDEAVHDVSDAVKERAAEMAKIEVAIAEVEKVTAEEKAAAKDIEIEF